MCICVYVSLNTLKSNTNPAKVITAWSVPTVPGYIQVRINHLELRSSPRQAGHLYPNLKEKSDHKYLLIVNKFWGKLEPIFLIRSIIRSLIHQFLSLWQTTPMSQVRCSQDPELKWKLFKSVTNKLLLFSISKNETLLLWPKDYPLL